MMNRRSGFLLVSTAVLVGWGLSLWFSPASEQLISEASPVPVKPAEVENAKGAAPTEAKVVNIKEQLPEELQQSFALVAQSYAAEVATPAYSRTLTAADTQLLAPNQFFAQTMPAAGGGSFTLEASQYRFSYPEAVRVSLLSSGIRLNDVRVELISEVDGTVLISQTVQNQNTENKNAAKQGEGRYDAELAAEKNWDGELRVQFSFDYQGERQQLQTGIEYSQPVAIITGVGSPSGIGADLVIPVALKVDKSGFYRLRANLFSQNKQPLAQLTATEKLSSGSASIDLKVHKSVLAGRAGPYLLNTFVLEQMSASPAEPTRYGKSAAPEYEVEYLSLDSLTDDVVEISVEEQQRLELLQKLAGQ